MQYLEDKNIEESKQKEAIDGFTDLQTESDQDQEWEITNAIRSHMNNYLHKLLYIIARLKRFITQFDA